MSGRTFEECKQDLGKVTDLPGVFKLWREAHAIEVEESVKQKLKGQNITKIKFEDEIYKKRKNTFSSHFAQFFESSKCDECVNDELGKNAKAKWEIALKNAFNADGTYGNYNVKNGGYKYICLLKEANDSRKICVKQDYLFYDEKVNKWILEETNSQEECVCQKKYNAYMLDKLNQAFAMFMKSVNKVECGDFKYEMAFMNVNKRGGTSTTAGRDETAVINYAEKYREFILKEIEILKKHRDNEVTIFVCGDENYFKRLMIALFSKDKEKIKNNEKNVYSKDNITFIKISHPSYWKVTPTELAKEMQGEIRK